MGLPVFAEQPILAAFDQGQRPTITLINQSTVPITQWLPAGITWEMLVAALQNYVDHYVAPVWGTPAKLVSGTQFVSGQWALVFYDTADVPGALGYHDVTPHGLPLSHVFVKTTQNDGQLVSVTASHELGEMLIDPAANLCAMAPDGTIYALEPWDAVENLAFNLNGVAMSDFVFPSWFEGFRQPKSDRFDLMAKCTRPYQILAGGYMPVMRPGQGWTQIFGDAAFATEFKRRDRRLQRESIRASRHMELAAKSIMAQGMEVQSMGANVNQAVA